MTAFYVYFNTKVGPTTDINLRKAIAYAFDYDALATIHNGAAKLMTSPFPDAVRAHIAVPGIYRQDLAKAREYLAKSNYPQGGIELEYVYAQGIEEASGLGRGFRVAQLHNGCVGRPSSG